MKSSLVWVAQITTAPAPSSLETCTCNHRHPPGHYPDIFFVKHPPRKIPKQTPNRTFSPDIPTELIGYFSREKSAGCRLSVTGHWERTLFGKSKFAC